MLVQRGQTGPDVTAVQTALQNLGWSNVNIDGSFGPITQQAVIDYQHLSGLAETGVVNDTTWASMQEDLGTSILNGLIPSLGPAVYNPSPTPTTNGGGTGPVTTVAAAPMSTAMMIGVGMLAVTLLMVAKKNGYL